MVSGPHLDQDQKSGGLGSTAGPGLGPSRSQVHSWTMTRKLSGLRSTAGPGPGVRWSRVHSWTEIIKKSFTSENSQFAGEPGGGCDWSTVLVFPTIGHWRPRRCGGAFRVQGGGRQCPQGPGTLERRARRRWAELCRFCRVFWTMSFHWSSEISLAQDGTPSEGSATAAMVLFTSSTWSAGRQEVNSVSSPEVLGQH